jgi:hypothetical protein
MNIAIKLKYVTKTARLGVNIECSDTDMSKCGLFCRSTTTRKRELCQRVLVHIVQLLSFHQKITSHDIDDKFSFRI